MFPCSKSIASAAMQPSITFGKVETDDGDFKHVELRQRLTRYKTAVIILVALLIDCMSTIAWLVFTSHYVCASGSEGSEANPDNNRVSNIGFQQAQNHALHEERQKRNSYDSRQESGVAQHQQPCYRSGLYSSRNKLKSTRDYSEYKTDKPSRHRPTTTAQQPETAASPTTSAVAVGRASWCAGSVRGRDRSCGQGIIRIRNRGYKSIGFDRLEREGNCERQSVIKTCCTNTKLVCQCQCVQQDQRDD